MGEEAGGERAFEPAEPGGRSFALALVAGILVAPVLGAAAGFGLGYLILEWFAGPYCCGLEGVLAPALGTMIGAGIGLIVGTGLALDFRKRRPLPRPLALVVIWALYLGIAWAGGTILELDYQDVAPVIAFHVVALVAPPTTWWLWGRERAGVSGRRGGGSRA